MANLANLTHDSGANNIPSIAKIWYQVYENVDEFPHFVAPDPTAAADLADLVTISGNIIMFAGHSFKEIYLTRETGELRFEQQGEFDGKSFVQTLEFLHPGSKAEVDGFSTMSNNANMVFIILDKEGKFYLIGGKYEEAKSAALTGGHGMAPADRKGSTFQFTFNSTVPRALFTGSVMLTNNPASPGGGGAQTIEA